MYLKTKKLARKGQALLCIFGALAGGMRAQSSTPPPATTTTTTTTTTPAASASDAEQQNVTTLEKFTVSDVPIESQILPTVRPISSVYGDDRSIIDIPRSVSSVNKAWMDDRQVKSSEDFGQFSPGVYSEALYGIPGVPQIRGDEAQVYVDGQLVPFSRNSVPLSFNGVEALDIVKGPGTAVYGPQGNGPGGYVNFVSKQPYFDADHADISATFGYWTSGHSYANPEYTIDFGGPLSDKLAYRVSYLARYGDEYYLNAKNETQDVFLALTYLFSKNVKLEWWAQGYSDRTNEITGANRVTQNFIWHGDYIGGPTEVTTSGPLQYFGYDTYQASDGNPATNFPSLADGAYQIVNPATAYHVKLPAYDALVGPNDTARAKLFESQLKTTIGLTPDSSIVNTSYYALESSDKFETYGYDEYVPKSLELQDRLEYRNKFDIGSIENNVITGIDLRYTYVRSYTDYTIEPFTYYDLYQPLSLVSYPGYTIQNDTFGSGLQVPGKPGYSSNEQQDTNIGDYAAFIQDDIKWTSKISTILGFREDYVTADTANPPLEEVAETGDNPQQIYSMPFLTYDGYYQVTPTFLDRGALYSYHASVVDPSYFASFIYKLTETQSLYATYDKVDAIHGTTNFGGISSGYKGADYVRDSIKVGSTLYEVGYKGSFLGNTLFFGVSAYQQIKSELQLRGPAFLVKTDGVEVDAVYQPTKSLSINANATYQNATAFGTSFFEETGDYLDAYATTTPVDGTFGTGVGAVNYGILNGFSYSPPGGRMKAPGVPSLIGNLFIDYKLGHGVSFGIGPSFIGRQYADDEDLIHIPGEYQVDGYIVWAPTKRWDVRLNVTNILNHRLLDPIDVNFAGNDTIFVRPPISASVTIRLHY
jgi:outer membrane receptor for Fe3+-dicitrate